MITVVVAEKASVGRDLARVLGATRVVPGGLEGEGWRVTWLNGHVGELFEPGDIDPAWRRWRLEDLPLLPRPIPWRVTERGRRRFEAARAAVTAPEVERVVCATDAGREGELIFRAFSELAGLEKPVERLWISSLTDAAIAEGLARLAPLERFDGLGRAALARAWVDWWVGMNASRALSLTHGETFAAGRVQTPTLALVVARDAAREAFAPEPFAALEAVLATPEGAELRVRVLGPEEEPSDPKAGRCPVDDPGLEARRAALDGAEAVLERLLVEERPLPAPPLHDLDLLQQDAHAAFGFTAARTLELAQRLYEKEKLLTYPRTGSRKLDASTAATLADRLGARSAEGLELGRHVDPAGVGDHHAILPTGRAAPPDLDPDAAALFALVEARLASAHAAPASLRVERAELDASGVRLVAEGRRLVEPGWTAHEPRGRPREAPLPEGLGEGVVLPIQRVHTIEGVTAPPPPLDDGALVRRMAELGLGTPATRAEIIEGLAARGYVERPPDAPAQLSSTELGRRLVGLAPTALTAPRLTAEVEAALEALAAGQLGLDDFAARAERFVTLLVGAIARGAEDPGAPWEAGALVVRVEPDRPLPPAGAIDPELSARLREGLPPELADALSGLASSLAVDLASPWLLTRGALLAGAERPGPAVVITADSPAGVLDEVMQLRALGLRADGLVPERSDEAARASCRAYLAGGLDVLFVHAELSDRSGLPEMLARGRPRAVAVDDAGRASPYHPRFAPRLLAARAVLEAVDAPAALISAACPALVARDAGERLGLGGVEVRALPWGSSGLALEGVCLEPRDRAPALRALVAEAAGPALVVTHGAERAEVLARAVGGVAMHAGLDPAALREARAGFQDGTIRALVAVEALSPRLDAPALRLLVLDGPPADVEGLAARLLGPAVLEDEVRAVVLHHPRDLERLEARLDRLAPPREALALVARHLASEPRTEAELARRSGLEGPLVARYLAALEAVGGAERGAKTVGARKSEAATPSEAPRTGAKTVGARKSEAAAPSEAAPPEAPRPGAKTVGARKSEAAPPEAPAWRAGEEGWAKRHRARRRRMEGGIRGVERWLRAPGCRLVALARVAGQPDEGDCGLCDACDPDGAALQRLRPPTAAELREAEALLALLDRSGSAPRSALFRAMQGAELGGGRAAFERLVDGLEAAGLICRRVEPGEARSRERLELTPLGRSPGGLGLLRLPASSGRAPGG